MDWNGRNYVIGDSKNTDVLNNCINIANTCLYAVIECAILISGFSPAIGFIHSGTNRAFVYDVSDIFKLDCAIGQAFMVASNVHNESDEYYKKLIRLKCIEVFKEKGLLKKVIPMIISLFREEDL